MAKRKLANEEPSTQGSGAIMEESIQCQVCAERMLGHIISCTAGHSVCTDCHGKLAQPKRCPQCRVPFPASRNRTLEDVVSKFTFACEHGCGKVAQPAELLAHQFQCDRAPIECPKCGQSIQPADLKHHLDSVHLSSEEDRDIALTEKVGAKFKTNTMILLAGNVSTFEEIEHIFLFDGPVKQSAYIKAILLDCGAWHFRVFHVMKELKFTMSFGKNSDASFMGKTESLRCLKGWNPHHTSKRSRHTGVLVFKDMLSALCDPGEDEPGWVQMDMTFG